MNMTQSGYMIATRSVIFIINAYDYFGPGGTEHVSEVYTVKDM